MKCVQANHIERGKGRTADLPKKNGGLTSVLHLLVSQLKINPLLCRGREDLQIKVKTRARIKVGLQTTNKLTREVCQMGTENSLDNMK